MENVTIHNLQNENFALRQENEQLKNALREIHKAACETQNTTIGFVDGIKRITSDNQTVKINLFNTEKHGNESAEEFHERMKKTVKSLNS